MKHEIIYSERYAFVISDDEPIEGDYLFCIENNSFPDEQITSGQLRYLDIDIFKKIIAHRPLTNSPILEGVPLLPQFGQENDLAELASRTHPFGNSERNAFIGGYNKAKETYKYTEEDLRKALLIKHDGLSVDYVIQSLQQPKRPNHFEFEMVGYVNPEWNEFPKTITNSEGKTEWVGKYSL
jgi:hypothetical protein